MSRAPRRPQCTRCGGRLVSVYQPQTNVHPNGYVQIMQLGYCTACKKNFTLRTAGARFYQPTLPLLVARVLPEDRICACGGPKSHTAARCQPCSVAARTFLPQDSAKGAYRGRHRNAPGLSVNQIANLLAKWVSQRRRCTYCPDPATTIDHVIPLTRGGDNYEGNLTPACRPCNSSKGNRLNVEWRACLSLIHI